MTTGRLVGVRVAQTDYEAFDDRNWNDWRPLLDWSVTLTYADGVESTSYCETETGAHRWAKDYLNQIIPIAGIAS